MSHRRTIITLLFLLAFAFGAWAQHSPLRASPPIGAVVQTWRYDEATRQVVMRVVNTSGKDITAFNISITMKRPDGSADFSEVTEDFLPLMVSVQESGDLRQRYGNGTFAAGTNRDETIPQIKGVKDVVAILDVVAYSDSTADVQNERAFNHLVVRRKGKLLAMQKANEVIQQVLADPKVANPSVAVATELTRLADVSHGLNRFLQEGQVVPQEIDLRTAAANLRNARVTASRKGMTERGYLEKYVAESQNRLAITSAQVNLTKTGGTQ